MNADFTPGPWRLRSDGEHDLRVVQVVEFDGEPEEDGATICGIPGLELSSDDDEANARLIAAAPELFEALRMCLLNGNLDEQERKAGEAALAKARGEA